ncbi:hypothetical protein DB42_CW00020 [Neochlamydia sp. EPS4]|nr:hypothetical protein DB42_CW00020 [Neochlamydia sp. EPS4]
MMLLGFSVKLVIKRLTMRKLTTLHSLHSLLTRPFFTVAQIKQLGISPARLAYYIKKKQIKRLGRGIYQSSDYQGSPEIFQWEDLIEAVNSVPGGVICLISALAIYEITEEIPRKHWIAISHSTSMTREGSIKIVRFRNMELGKTEVELGGIRLPIFDRERTIIDAFRLLSRETAIKALKMALLKKGNKIDLKRLQTYAKKLRFNIDPYLITATT